MRLELWLPRVHLSRRFRRKLGGAAARGAWPSAAPALVTPHPEAALAAQAEGRALKRRRGQLELTAAILVGAPPPLAHPRGRLRAHAERRARGRRPHRGGRHWRKLSLEVCTEARLLHSQCLLGAQPRRRAQHAGGSARIIAIREVAPNGALRHTPPELRCPAKQGLVDSGGRPRGRRLASAGSLGTRRWRLRGLGLGLRRRPRRRRRRRRMRPLQQYM
eukprot:scaffold123079_cov63-Phaeocystis_antarctica.AAC.4